MPWAIEVDCGDKIVRWFAWDGETSDPSRRVAFDSRDRAEAVMGLCGLFRMRGWSMRVVEIRPMKSVRSTRKLTKPGRKA